MTIDILFEARPALTEKERILFQEKSKTEKERIIQNCHKAIEALNCNPHGGFLSMFNRLMKEYSELL